MHLLKVLYFLGAVVNCRLELTWLVLIRMILNRWILTSIFHLRCLNITWPNRLVNSLPPWFSLSSIGCLSYCGHPISFQWWIHMFLFESKRLNLFFVGLYCWNWWRACMIFLKLKLMILHVFGCLYILIWNWNSAIILIEYNRKRAIALVVLEAAFVEVVKIRINTDFGIVVFKGKEYFIFVWWIMGIFLSL